MQRAKKREGEFVSPVHSTTVVGRACSSTSGARNAIRVPNIVLFTLQFGHIPSPLLQQPGLAREADAVLANQKIGFRHFLPLKG